MRNLLAGFILPVVVLGARADVVFSRPPGAGGALISSSWLDPDGSDADMYAYDSFVLGADTAITEVRWRGGYGHGALYGRAWNFTVTVYESIAGGSQPHLNNPQLPEFYLAFYDVGGAAGETPAGTFGGVVMYDYRFVLPTPFQATAGVKYWLRIEAAQTGYPDWGIATAAGGDGADGQHFQFSTGAARFSMASGDTAFDLLTSGAPTVTIAASAEPGAGGTVTGGGIYPVGTAVSLTATPAAGYAFVNWTENGVEVSAAADYNFTASVARTLAANFAAAYTITTRASPTTGGTTTGDGPYRGGVSVTVVATPKGPNYVFVDWSENGVPVSLAARYSFTATADRALVATFVPANANVAPVYSQPHDGSGTVMKSAWFPPNGLNGDEFVYDSFILDSTQAVSEIRWRGGYINSPLGFGESPVYDFTVRILDSMAAGSQPNILGPALVEYSTGGNAGEVLAGAFGSMPLYDYAFVLPTSFTATAGTKYWVQIEASQGLSPFPAYWPPDWGLAVASGGDGHHFREVSGGTGGRGGTLYQTVTNDTAFTLLAPAGSGHTIAAAASPAAAATVSGGGCHAPGTTATVVATPNPGYAFATWTELGVVVSTSASYSFTVAADRTLVASLVTACTVTVDASPAGGGAVSGGGSYANGAPVTVTATPNPGYGFVNWTEGGVEVSASATYTFTAGADRALVAQFADTQPPVVSITRPASGDRVSRATVVAFTDTEPTSPQVSVDSVHWTGATSGVTSLGDIPEFAGLPDGSFALYLRDTDVAGNTGSTNVAGVLKETPAPVAAPLTFAPGWNLVSVPVEPLSTAVEVVFGASSGRAVFAAAAGAERGGNALVYAGAVYEWAAGNGGRYVGAIHVHAMTGYWVYVPAGAALAVAGTPVSGAVNLATGWNVVGPAATVPAPSRAELGSTWWQWNADGQCYEAAATLYPGSAYMVYARAPVLLGLGR